jgi:hypothetical protein
LGKGTSFRERDGYRPAGARPISSPSSGGNSETFIEQEKYVPTPSTPPLENNNKAFTSLEKDWYHLSGINPLTNNYPPGGGGGGEQVITDAILTTTGEYIDVGNNFYLSF